MMNENMTDANSAVFNTDIDKMNMITLKEELRKRGGRVGGNKQELCQRLRAYMKMGIRLTTDPPTENRPTSIFPSDMNFKDLSISFLPHVKLSHIDLMDYFVFRKSEIDGAPVKNYKSLCDAGYNLFNERFIEIIKCVFECDRVFVLSSVRSQFTKNKQYTVKLILDRCGSGILAASCECVAGVGPKACCKHTAALCYALEYFSKTGLIKCSETPTDVLQTFHQPARKRKVHGSPVKVSNLPIATGSRLCFDPRPVPLRNEEGYESYVKHLMENSGMKLSYLSSLPKPEVNVLSVAHDHFYDTNYLPELVSVSEDSIRDIERKTRGQSRCALWYKERRCRLTASYFGRICHTQDFKTLAHTIIAGSQYQNKFMKWGLDMECLARRRYEEITDHSVSTCGLIIHRTKNYLAASCDGLIGNDRVLELKGVPSHAYDKVLDEVKQLEDLKHSFGKTFSVLKQHSSVYTDVNGQREGHSEIREEVKSDGKLLARVDQKMDSSQGAENATPATRVRTEVEVPSRGIHKTMEQQTTENGNRRSVPHDPGNSVEKYIPYSGVQYSPLDMAEYVFWTGDEKGVTLAIEEFLQEGLMSREEAINFLQEIKLNLEYLQNHYSQQRLHKQEEQQAKERAALIQKALGLDKPRAMSEPKNSDLSSESLLEKKSSADVPVTTKEVAMLSSNRVQQQNVGLSDEDYEELLERLRVADFLYTEYSLEEVIYQLAKVMFSQSLTRGSAEAQEALQKFTNFLEAEAEQGHISRSLEKKVLDVLIAALTDTLSEQPHLVNAAREGLAGSSSNQLLHQLLLLNPGGAAGEAVSAGSVAEAATSESHQSTLAKGRERQEDNTKTNKTT